MELNRPAMTIAPEIEDLLALPGVSGYEDAVRDYLEARVKHMSPQVDAMGNLTVTIGATGPRVLIVAHMDEIGFVVSGIAPNGFVRFRKIGTIDNRLLAGRHVSLHTPNGAIAGVIGTVPPHHGGSQGSNSETLGIDIGATSAAEARQYGVDLLQSVTFVKHPRVYAETRINCRGIDNRIGCALVLWACEHAFQADVAATLTFAWSVQEEVGLRGGNGLAASGRRFDVIIPVDACATSDGPNHARRLANFPLGGGPVLRMIDHGSIGSPLLANWLRALAERHNIPLQRGVTGGETDGVPLQTTGAHMVPLTIPMRYLHSLAETADLRDVDAARRLFEHLVREAATLPACAAMSASNAVHRKDRTT